MKSKGEVKRRCRFGGKKKNHNNNKDNNNNIGNANSMHGTNRAVSTALGHVASKLSMRIYCVKQYE